MFVEVRFSGEGLDVNGEVCGGSRFEPLRSISILGQTGRKRLVGAEAWTWNTHPRSVAAVLSDSVGKTFESIDLVEEPQPVGHGDGAPGWWFYCINNPACTNFLCFFVTTHAVHPQRVQRFSLILQFWNVEGQVPTAIP